MSSEGSESDRAAAAEEETGRPDEARAVHAKLLEIWKEADPDLAPLLEARRAHQRLSQGRRRSSRLGRRAAI